MLNEVLELLYSGLRGRVRECPYSFFADVLLICKTELNQILDEIDFYTFLDEPLVSSCDV